MDTIAWSDRNKILAEIQSKSSKITATSVVATSTVILLDLDRNSAEIVVINWPEFNENLITIRPNSKSDGTAVGFWPNCDQVPAGLEV